MAWLSEENEKYSRPRWRDNVWLLFLRIRTPSRVLTMLYIASNRPRPKALNTCFLSFCFWNTNLSLFLALIRSSLVYALPRYFEAFENWFELYRIHFRLHINHTRFTLLKLKTFFVVTLRRSRRRREKEGNSKSTISSTVNEFSKIKQIYYASWNAFTHPTSCQGSSTQGLSLLRVVRHS